MRILAMHGDASMRAYARALGLHSAVQPFTACFQSDFATPHIAKPASRSCMPYHRSAFHADASDFCFGRCIRALFPLFCTSEGLGRQVVSCRPAECSMAASPLISKCTQENSQIKRLIKSCRSDIACASTIVMLATCV